MDSRIGMTIGDFEIVKLIGRGGMSSVYMASDKELERHVALKIPHERFVDSPSFVKRFRREAKAMARLRHPNIVQIYSVGSHEEMPFFAMEHVRGESLERTVKTRGPLSIDTALRYISQIARAIEYAHDKGVIHRDIKPANILIDSSGRVLLTDFGVSKLLSEEVTQDTIGFVGTPQYMSPEQCGQGTLDHRTDIYSMGAVLFEILTGQAAFSSSSPAEVIKKQLFDMPEFPAEFRESIPDDLQALISKMLAKDPGERYQDIPSLLRDIERLGCGTGDLSELYSGADTNPLDQTPAALSRSIRVRLRGRRRRALVFACMFVVLAGVSLAAFLPDRGAGASPAGQSATLILNSDPPGARVVLDSEPRGVTPLSLSGVSPGRHMLALRLEGYPDHNRKTLVAAGKSLGICHDFATAKEALIPKGQLVIDTEPRGAAVYINGKKMGTTRLELTGLRSADYTVALSLNGYESVKKQIRLLPDENLRISLALVEEPRHGSLTVNSRPPGADVLLNGKYRGSTPLTLGKVPTGQYDVTLKKKGYKLHHEDFTCKMNVAGTVEAALEMTPKYSARENMIAGDRGAQMGDFAGAARAYERAMSLDPDNAVYPRKLKQARGSLVRKEIRDLLSSYKLAYDSENAKLLASLLDGGDPEFLPDQVANAESLFREFDNIDVDISNPRVSLRKPGEVSVKLHLSMSADFTETGVAAELLNADRKLTLRRYPEAGWKICAIE